MEPALRSQLVALLEKEDVRTSKQLERLSDADVTNLRGCNMGERSSLRAVVAGASGAGSAKKNSVDIQRKCTEFGWSIPQTSAVPREMVEFFQERIARRRVEGVREPFIFADLNKKPFAAHAFLASEENGERCARAPPQRGVERRNVRQVA